MKYICISAKTGAGLPKVLAELVKEKEGKVEVKI
jgi:hypothetical protein